MQRNQTNLDEPEDFHIFFAWFFTAFAEALFLERKLEIAPNSQIY